MLYLSFHLAAHSAISYYFWQVSSPLNFPARSSTAFGLSTAVPRANYDWRKPRGDGENKWLALRNFQNSRYSDESDARNTIFQILNLFKCILSIMFSYNCSKRVNICSKPRSRALPPVSTEKKGVQKKAETLPRHQALDRSKNTSPRPEGAAAPLDRRAAQYTA